MTIDNGVLFGHPVHSFSRPFSHNFFSVFLNVMHTVRWQWTTPRGRFLSFVRFFSLGVSRMMMCTRWWQLLRQMQHTSCSFPPLICSCCNCRSSSAGEGRGNVFRIWGRDVPYSAVTSVSCWTNPITQRQRRRRWTSDIECRRCLRCLTSNTLSWRSRRRPLMTDRARLGAISPSGRSLSLTSRGRKERWRHENVRSDRSRDHHVTPVRRAGQSIASSSWRITRRPAGRLASFWPQSGSSGRRGVEGSFMHGGLPFRHVTAARRRQSIL